MFGKKSLRDAFFQDEQSFLKWTVFPQGEQCFFIVDRISPGWTVSSEWEVFSVDNVSL